MKTYNTLSLIMAIILSGCAKTEFKGAAKAVPIAKEKPAVAPESEANVTPGSQDVEAEAIAADVKSLVDKTQNFSIQKTSTPLDMLWVIDNSASMREEVEQVRRNLDLFMMSITSRADVKLTLISDKGSIGTKMELKQSYIDQGHQQIVAFVGSNNLLDIAAASLCGIEETEVTVETLATLPTDKLCGLPLVETRFGNKFDVNLVRGTFKSRLRPSSKKVLVFVTDDDEQWMIRADNFLSATKLDSKEVSVFAFRGDESQPKFGCRIANKGRAFEEFATQTNGSVFDICELDWSANFATLSNSLVKLAATSFQITDAKNLVKVSKVTVGDVVLAPSQYVVEGASVRLIDDMAALAADTLTIYYQVYE